MKISVTKRFAVVISKVATRQRKIHGCKVFRLAKGLDSDSAFAKISASMGGVNGSRVRRGLNRICFHHWTYDPRSGKARAFG